MRNFIILSAIVIAFAFGCNDSSSNTRPAVLKTDSANVLCFYKDLYDGLPKQGVVVRVVKDSFIYVYADTSVNNERKWSRDTAYIVDVAVPVDSARSKQFKMPIKDSTGKQNYIYYKVPTHKRFIRSGWDHVDSILINGLRNQQ